MTSQDMNNATVTIGMITVQLKRMGIEPEIHHVHQAEGDGMIHITTILYTDSFARRKYMISRASTRYPELAYGYALTDFLAALVNDMENREAKHAKG